MASLELQKDLYETKGKEGGGGVPWFEMKLHGRPILYYECGFFANQVGNFQRPEMGCKMQ